MTTGMLASVFCISIRIINLSVCIKFVLLTEPIHALEAQTIIDMSCGSNHSVAICSEGNIFTWGNGLHGELGSGQVPQKSPIPR